MAEGSMPQQQQQYPNLNPYTSSNGTASQTPQTGSTGQSYGQQAQNAGNSLMNNASNTMSNIKNSETVQSMQNAPVVDKARVEADKTGSEFGNLANARQTPQTQTATGQKLTHYHSFFYNLLSWENPRATAISYVAIVFAIFAFRYLPIARWGLRLTWIVLGITAAAEIAGKTVLGQGFASKMRPARYYTIPRETLDSMMGDLEELVNFFVIEFQRITFAENVYATVGAFFTALLTYFLIKITPAWGLGLLFTTVLFFAPLVYISNKEFIDHHLNNAGELIGQQTQQVRDLAAHHSNRAMEASQGALKDYTSKAQEMIGQSKKSAVNQGYVSQEKADNVIGKPEQANTSDLPSVPKVDPVAPQTTSQPQTGSSEPMLSQ